MTIITTLSVINSILVLLVGIAIYKLFTKIELPKVESASEYYTAVSMLADSQTQDELEEALAFAREKLPAHQKVSFFEENRETILMKQEII